MKSPPERPDRIKVFITLHTEAGHFHQLQSFVPYDDRRWMQWMKATGTVTTDRAFDDDIITKREAARLLGGVGERTVERGIRGGLIPGAKTAKGWIVFRSGLLAWMAKRKAKELSRRGAGSRSKERHA